jgi:hypothetical protein
MEILGVKIIKTIEKVAFYGGLYEAVNLHKNFAKVIKKLQK